MKKTLLIALICLAVTFVFTACGGSGDKPATGDKAEAKTVAKVEEKAPAEDKGVVIAKEILAAWDLAWGEVLVLVKDKPAAADVKAQVQEVIDKYAEKMKQINARYLALKEEDIALFGSANGYMGENRGKHVFKKDAAFDAIVYHYMQEKDQEMVDLLKKEVINLLEIAVKH